MFKSPRFLAAFLLLFAPLLLRAQTSVPPNQVSAHKDTSSLKPPAGAKIAVIEYEDLECPRCAQAFPVVHEAVKKYNIPLIECDFQIPYHHWSHDAALCAHYLKAKISPKLAEEYRREVFASQSRISSREDLQHFNQAFFTRNGQQMPFVMDPTGEFGREIDATTAKGRDIGFIGTPAIFVVTANHWIEVADPMRLEEALDQAKAELGDTKAAPAVRSSKHVRS
jgi:protein-disulfide isomerase